VVPLPKINPIEPKGEKNMGTVRKGFASTYGIIFKRQPGHKLEDYGAWLASHSIAVEPCTTPYGRKATRAKDFTWMKAIPKSRLVSIFELLEIGKHPMPEKAAASLGSMFSYMRDSLFATCEFYDGENSNVNETPCAYGAVGTYRAFDATDAENVAYTSIALNTKFVYGGNWLLESEFCMNCNYSNHLARCLEMDFCTKCADCYFCHNCEGLTDCMFCFNMKGARYCIGNTQLTKEEYMKARDALLKRMAGELDAKCALPYSIFTIGASHGK